MHDAGVDHRDLNLGNLLLRASAAGVEAFIVDLDAARLCAGPLPFAARQRALRRLERSLVKIGDGDPGEQSRARLYEAYAGDDAGLAQRLGRGRRVGRMWIHLHALSWRR
jgi:hypothetical protein